MTRTFFATLGLVGLGAAIVIGTFAAFGVFGDQAPASPVTPEAQPERVREIEETVSVADIGETVVAGNVSWTVIDASHETGIHKYTFPQSTEPGEYVNITFTAENVSEDPVTLTGEMITVLDDQGREYRPESNRNDAFIPHEENLLFSEAGLIGPGETREGQVNIEVLPGASGFIVRLGDADPALTQEGYVDLGF